jgi:hypothetical protein
MGLRSSVSLLQLKTDSIFSLSIRGKAQDEIMKSFLTLLLTLNSIIYYQTPVYKVKKIIGLFH